VVMGFTPILSSYGRGFVIESLSFGLPIFHEHFLLTPGFSPGKQRNICTTTHFLDD